MFCALAGLAAQAAAQDPGADSPHGTLNIPCITCHTSDGWRPARIGPGFKHATYGFALQEGHGAVACASCHTSLEFSKVQKTCAGCHRDVHQGELGVDCAQCHNTRAFADRAPQIQAHALTRFPLDGAHRSVDCASCHTSRNGASLVFRGAPTDCVGCHRQDFQKTTNPAHPAAGFPTDCLSCHTNVTWRTATFNHNTTQFPLTGAHQAANCQACHSDGVYKGKPTTCVSCHQASFNQTKAPPHPAAGIPTDCANCHTTTTWTGASFDHNATQFPLTGAHQAATCQACHSDGLYVGKPTTCVSCHQTDFNGTTSPAHQAAGFPTTCTTCHTTVTWTGAVFNHNTTQFPLTGAHQAATCQACHSDGVYHGKPTTCVSCHQTDFNGTTSPPHQAAGFPTTCTTCHTTVTWTGAVFNHNTTQFPLTGAHQAANCQACHADGVYHGKPTTCVSCHQPDFNGTTSPPHQAAAFPTTCATCHTTVTWTGAVFNHNTTQFPLTGAHQAANCQACHGDGVYHGKPTTCVSCHQPDYNGTTNPNHQASGFSTTCATCHTTVTWTGAVFNHNATQFPLTGAHIATPCQSCHGDGVYHGKPTTCVSCHQTDYTGTTSPAHQAAGFPTTCTTCHTTVTWTGASFDHNATQFPLTGAHTATPCQSCHGDGVYHGKPTACAACHQTDFNGTTSPPHQAAGFATTCATCHTTITWIGAVFNHNATQFPLTGAHIATPCQSCHGDGVYHGKPTTCVSCHQTDYTGTTGPPHQAAGFPTTCATCHTTVTWIGAVFNHSATQFPLTGAHLATPCQSCHGDGVYQGKPTTCVSCHQTDFNGTTSPPHQAAGFATTCATCHTTVTWIGAVFNHSTTQFPLTGVHATTPCQACHGDGVYQGKPTTCVSCHQTDYAGTTNPNHQSAGFPTDCASCHTTTTWLGATFDHDGQFFPIYSGRHRGTWSTCADCHTNSASFAQFTCLTCHEHSKSSMDSKHQGRSGYSYNSTACYSCHPRGRAD